MQGKRILSLVLCALLVLTVFPSFNFEVAVNAQSQINDTYVSVDVSADKSYYFLNEICNITILSNSSDPIQLSIFNPSGTTVYQKDVNPNTTINYSFSESHEYGLYLVKCDSFTTWFWLQKTEKTEEVVLPYSWNWKGIDYVLTENFELQVKSKNGFFTTEWLSEINTKLKPTNRVFVNEHLLLIESEGKDVSMQSWLMCQYQGLKIRLNGTLAKDTTLKWDLKEFGESDKIAWGLNSLRTGNLVYDWSDFDKTGVSYNIDKTSLKTNVYLSTSFDVDPVIFEDGFESGDFSAWTGTSVVGTGSTNAVISTNPYSGTYCSEHYVGAGNGLRAYAQKSFTAQTTAYARAYIKFANVPTGTDDHWRFLVLYGASDSKIVVNAKIVNSFETGGVRWSIQYKDGDSYTLDRSYSDSRPVADTWYCVEIKAVVDGSVGEARMWVDGVEIYTETGLTNNGATSSVDSTRVGEVYSWGDDAHTIYSDCVVVSDAYIGPEEEETTENIFGSVLPQVTVNSGKFISFSAYCDVTPLLTVASQIANSFNRYGYIDSSTSTVNSKTIQVTKYHSINPQYNLFSSNLWSFNREGAVYQLLTLDGWLETLQTQNVFGDVTPLIIIDSNLEWAVVKYGDIEIVCQITESQTTSFDLYLSINPVFVIVGHYSAEAEIYGLIGQILGVASYNLYVFESTGDIGQTIAIATAKTVTVKQLMDILYQMGIEGVSFKNLIKNISITEQFNIESATLNDLIKYGFISETLTVNSKTFMALVRSGAIDSRFMIDSLTLKGMITAGIVNQTVTVNSITFETWLRSGIINLDVSVNGIDYVEFARTGAISETFTVDSLTLKDFVAMGIINQDVTLDAETQTTLIKAGIILETFVIDGTYSTFEELLLSGAINLDLTINDEVLQALIKAGLISESFTVNSLTLNDLLKAGLIDQTVTLDGVTLESLIKAGIINLNITLNDINLSELAKAGLIDETFTLDDIILEDLIKLGIIDESFTIHSLTLKNLVEGGFINQTVTLDSQKQMMLMKAKIISETFVIDGTYNTFEGLLLSGAINLDLTINDEVLQALIKAGLISETFTVDGLTLEDLIRMGVIDVTATLDAETLLELIKAGIIPETILVDKQKAMSFNLFTSINEDFTIESIIDAFVGVIEWIYGAITEVFSINTITNFLAPYGAGETIFVRGKGIFFIAVALVMAVLGLVLMKRKQKS